MADKSRRRVEEHEVSEMNYKTAYCLMIYKCSHCKHMEILWNSRDGVTPFTVDCRCCKELSMQHILWNEDTLVGESYAPLENMRIFINLTKEKIRQHIIKNKKQYQHIDANFESIVTELYGNGDAPDIITGKEFNRSTK